MLPRENHLFGCIRPDPSQGSIQIGVAPASDFGFCFQCDRAEAQCCVHPLRPPRLSGTGPLATEKIPGIPFKTVPSASHQTTFWPNESVNHGLIHGSDGARGATSKKETLALLQDFDQKSVGAGDHPDVTSSFRREFPPPDSSPGDAPTFWSTSPELSG